MNIHSGEIIAYHWATGQPVRLAWKDGVISSLDPETRQPRGKIWLAPALFDLQLNGFGGVDFQREDLTEHDLLHAVRVAQAAGCGRFLLTLTTAPWPSLTGRLRHIAALRAQSPELQSAIAGWHIEGPFLSPAAGFRGGHNPAHMLDPTPERIRELRALAGNDPLLLTIAPERPGGLEAIALAVSLGARVSLGHTNASADQIGAAVRAGATGFTHLGNGCPRDLDRHDNILWRVLDGSGLTVSLIPDRIHVSPSLFRLIHRSMPSDDILYVTDAMSAGGAGPGRYRIGALEVEVGADQVVRMPGEPAYFAGSALSPMDGIFRAAAMLDVSWRPLWRRMSSLPARFMGLTHELAAGQPATFCLLTEQDPHAPPALRFFDRGRECLAPTKRP
jgi:N-acetylglucosamine-6-phosphate deacetylase